MDKEPNPPAFPQFDYGNRGSGMTLRDYFAAAMMPAAMFRTNGDRHTVAEAANIAYRYADALMAERLK